MGEMKLSSVTLLFQQRALSSCPLVNLEIDLRDSISSVKMGVYAHDPPGNVKATRKANRSSSCDGGGSFRPIICVATVHKLHGLNAEDLILDTSFKMQKKCDCNLADK